MVKYTVTIELDDTPIKGNVMASGDDAYDRECEAEVTARLFKDEIEAWCVVTVRAEAGGLTGIAHLGGCSLDATYTAEVAAKEHGLHEEALADLKAKLERAALAYKQLD